MTSFFAVNPSNERLSNHAQRSSWPRPPPPELRATRLGVTAELDANHVLHKCHPANAPPERRCEPGLARPGAAERGLHPGAAQPGAPEPASGRRPAPWESPPLPLRNPHVSHGVETRESRP